MELMNRQQGIKNSDSDGHGAGDNKVAQLLYGSLNPSPNLLAKLLTAVEGYVLSKARLVSSKVLRSGSLFACLPGLIPIEPSLCGIHSTKRLVGAARVRA